MSAGNVARRLTQGAIRERIEQHLYDEYTKRFASVVESSRQWLNSDGRKLLCSTAIAATASIGATRIGGVQHAISVLTHQGTANKKKKATAGENASYSPLLVLSYDDVQTPCASAPTPRQPSQRPGTAPCPSTPLSASKRPVSRVVPTPTPLRQTAPKLVIPPAFAPKECAVVVPLIRQATTNTAAANPPSATGTATATTANPTIVAVTPTVHGPVRATAAPVKVTTTTVVVQTVTEKTTVSLELPEPGLRAAAPAEKAAPEPVPVPNTEKPPKPQAMSPPSTVAASSMTSVDSDSDSELTASSFEDSSVEADSSTSMASMSGTSAEQSKAQQPVCRRCPLCNGMIPEADFHAHIRELKCKAATPTRPQQPQQIQPAQSGAKKELTPQPQPPPPKPEPAPKSTAAVKQPPVPTSQEKQTTAVAVGLPAGVLGATYSSAPQRPVVQMPPVAASVLAKPPMPIPIPQLPAQLPSAATTAKLPAKKTSGELMPPPNFTPNKSGKKSPAPNVLLSPQPKPVTASQEMASSAGKGYEISVCHDSESDYDSEEEFRRKKHRVPMWAKGEALSRALAAQESVDPDAIFQCSTSCDLSEIFKGVTKQSQRQRFRNRTSSGNWQADKATWKDEIEYKKQMGFMK